MPHINQKNQKYLEQITQFAENYQKDEKPGYYKATGQGLERINGWEKFKEVCKGIIGNIFSRWLDTTKSGWSDATQKEYLKAEFVHILHELQKDPGLSKEEKDNLYVNIINAAKSVGLIIKRDENAIKKNKGRKEKPKEKVDPLIKTLVRSFFKPVKEAAALTPAEQKALLIKEAGELEKEFYETKKQVLEKFFGNEAEIAHIHDFATVTIEQPEQPREGETPKKTLEPKDRVEQPGEQPAVKAPEPKQPEEEKGEKPDVEKSKVVEEQLSKVIIESAESEVEETESNQKFINLTGQVSTLESVQVSNLEEEDSNFAKRSEEEGGEELDAKAGEQNLGERNLDKENLKDSNEAPKNPNLTIPTQEESGTGRLVESNVKSEANGSQKNKEASQTSESTSAEALSPSESIHKVRARNLQAKEKSPETSIGKKIALYIFSLGGLATVVYGAYKGFYPTLETTSQGAALQAPNGSQITPSDANHHLSNFRTPFDPTFGVGQTPLELNPSSLEAWREIWINEKRIVPPSFKRIDTSLLSEEKLKATLKESFFSENDVNDPNIQAQIEELYKLTRNTSLDLTKNLLEVQREMVPKIAGLLTDKVEDPYAEAKNVCGLVQERVFEKDDIALEDIQKDLNSCFNLPQGSPELEQCLATVTNSTIKIKGQTLNNLQSNIPSGIDKEQYTGVVWDIIRTTLVTAGFSLGIIALLLEEKVREAEVRIMEEEVVEGGGGNEPLPLAAEQEKLNGAQASQEDISKALIKCSEEGNIEELEQQLMDEVKSKWGELVQDFPKQKKPESFHELKGALENNLELFKKLKEKGQFLPLFIKVLAASDSPLSSLNEFQIESKKLFTLASRKPPHIEACKLLVKNGVSFNVTVMGNLCGSFHTLTSDERNFVIDLINNRKDKLKADDFKILIRSIPRANKMQKSLHEIYTVPKYSELMDTMLRKTNTKNKGKMFNAVWKRFGSVFNQTLETYDKEAFTQSWEDFEINSLLNKARMQGALVPDYDNFATPERRGNTLMSLWDRGLKELAILCLRRGVDQSNAQNLLSKVAPLIDDDLDLQLVELAVEKGGNLLRSNSPGARTSLQEMLESPYVREPKESEKRVCALIEKTNIPSLNEYMKSFYKILQLDSLNNPQIVKALIQKMPMPDLKSSDYNTHATEALKETLKETLGIHENISDEEAIRRAHIAVIEQVIDVHGPHYVGFLPENYKEITEKAVEKYKKREEASKELVNYLKNKPDLLEQFSDLDFIHGDKLSRKMTSELHIERFLSNVDDENALRLLAHVEVKVANAFLKGAIRKKEYKKCLTIMDAECSHLIALTMTTSNYLSASETYYLSASETEIKSIEQIIAKCTLTTTDLMDVIGKLPPLDTQTKESEKVGTLVELLIKQVKDFDINFQDPEKGSLFYLLMERMPEEELKKLLTHPVDDQIQRQAMALKTFKSYLIKFLGEKGGQQGLSEEQIKANFSDILQSNSIKTIEFELKRRNLSIVDIYNYGKDKNEDILRNFIDAGADVDARSKNGDTLFMVAAEKNDFEVCELLIEKKSDPFIQNREKTPLQTIINKEVFTPQWGQLIEKIIYKATPKQIAQFLVNIQDLENTSNEGISKIIAQLVHQKDRAALKDIGQKLSKKKALEVLNFIALNEEPSVWINFVSAAEDLNNLVQLKTDGSFFLMLRKFYSKTDSKHLTDDEQDKVLNILKLNQVKLVLSDYVNLLKEIVSWLQVAPDFLYEVNLALCKKVDWDTMDDLRLKTIINNVIELMKDKPQELKILEMHQLVMRQGRSIELDAVIKKLKAPNMPQKEESKIEKVFSVLGEQNALEAPNIPQDFKDLSPHKQSEFLIELYKREEGENIKKAVEQLSKEPKKIPLLLKTFTKEAPNPSIWIGVMGSLSELVLSEKTSSPLVEMLAKYYKEGGEEIESTDQNKLLDLLKKIPSIKADSYSSDLSELVKMLPTGGGDFIVKVINVLCEKVDWNTMTEGGIRVLMESFGNKDYGISILQKHLDVLKSLKQETLNEFVKELMKNLNILMKGLQGQKKLLLKDEIRPEVAANVDIDKVSVKELEQQLMDEVKSKWGELVQDFPKQKKPESFHELKRALENNLELFKKLKGKGQFLPLFIKVLAASDSTPYILDYFQIKGLKLIILASMDPPHIEACKLLVEKDPNVHLKVIENLVGSFHTLTSDDRNFVIDLIKNRKNTLSIAEFETLIHNIPTVNKKPSHNLDSAINYSALIGTMLQKTEADDIIKKDTMFNTVWNRFGSMFNQTLETYDKGAFTELWRKFEITRLLDKARHKLRLRGMGWVVPRYDILIQNLLEGDTAILVNLWKLDSKELVIMFLGGGVQKAAAQKLLDEVAPNIKDDFDLKIVELAVENGGNLLGIKSPGGRTLLQEMLELPYMRNIHNSKEEQGRVCTLIKRTNITTLDQYMQSFYKILQMDFNNPQIVKTIINKMPRPDPASYDFYKAGALKVTLGIKDETLSYSELIKKAHTAVIEQVIDMHGPAYVDSLPQEFKEITANAVEKYNKREKANKELVDYLKKKPGLLKDVEELLEKTLNDQLPRSLLHNKNQMKIFYSIVKDDKEALLHAARVEAKVADILLSWAVQYMEYENCLTIMDAECNSLIALELISRSDYLWAEQTERKSIAKIIAKCTLTTHALMDVIDKLPSLETQNQAPLKEGIGTLVGLLIERVNDFDINFQDPKKGSLLHLLIEKMPENEFKELITAKKYSINEQILSQANALKTFKSRLVKFLNWNTGEAEEKIKNPKGRWGNLLRSNSIQEIERNLNQAKLTIKNILLYDEKMLESFIDAGTTQLDSMIEGETLLMSAIEKRNYKLCKLLIEKGSNPFLKCKGKMPLQGLIEWNGSPELEELIKKIIDSSTPQQLANHLGNLKADSKWTPIILNKIWGRDFKAFKYDDRIATRNTPNIEAEVKASANEKERFEEVFAAKSSVTSSIVNAIDRSLTYLSHLVLDKGRNNPLSEDKEDELKRESYKRFGIFLESLGIASLEIDPTREIAKFNLLKWVQGQVDLLDRKTVSQTSDKDNLKRILETKNLSSLGAILLSKNKIFGGIPSRVLEDALIFNVLDENPKLKFFIENIIFMDQGEERIKSAKILLKYSGEKKEDYLKELIGSLNRTNEDHFLKITEEFTFNKSQVISILNLKVTPDFISKIINKIDSNLTVDEKRETINRAIEKNKDLKLDDIIIENRDIMEQEVALYEIFKKLETLKNSQLPNWINKFNDFRSNVSTKEKVDELKGKLKLAKMEELAIDDLIKRAGLSDVA